MRAKVVTYLESKLPVYDEADRVKWDLFISVLILIAAFEIPYDWLVGWKDQMWAHVFNLIFFISFFIDMVLNSLTQRREEPWFFTQMLNWFREPNKKVKSRMLLKPSETSLGYAKSIWFPIDFLSTIPWSFFAELFSPLNSLRLLRLLRLARLFKVLRLTKALYLLERIRRAMPTAPSVERLFFLFLSIPWITHLFACVFYAFEKHNPAVTYGNSFYYMWMALMTQQVGNDPISSGSFWLFMSAIVLSVFVFASVTGNFAAIYTGMDFSSRRKTSVLLKQHTVVIGWNKNIYSIVSELQTGSNKAPVVLLSPHSESTVIRLFEENGVQFDPRHVTIYEGSIYSTANIDLLALEQAKNIIIIGLDQDGDTSVSEATEQKNADIVVLKVLLACTQILNQKQEKGFARPKDDKITIVAAVHSEKNAKLLRSGIPTYNTRDKALFSLQVVDVEDILSRCLVQATLQPQLVDVFSELFSYEYDASRQERDNSIEVYVIPILEGKEQKYSSLIGKTFDQILSMFTQSEVIGYFTASDKVIAEAEQIYKRKSPPSVEKILVLNPGYRSHYDEQKGNHTLRLPEELNHRFQDGDELVVLAHTKEELGFIAGTDTSLSLSLKDYKMLSNLDVKQTVPTETILLLGTSRKAEKIAELLPEYLPCSSKVYSQVPKPKKIKGNTTFLPIPKLKTSEHYDIFDALSNLKDTHFTRRVVVSDAQDRAHHDANILMTLTALHAATEDAALDRQVHTIFEIIDQQNQKLADTFHLKNRKVASLLSTEMVSDYLIQLANQPKRGRVYQELLDRLGNEIYFDEYERYIQMIANEDGESETTPSYRELELIARVCGRVVIGLHGKKYVNTTAEGSETYTLLSPTFGQNKSNGQRKSDGIDGLYFDRPIPLETGTVPKEIEERGANQTEPKARRTVSHVIVVGPGPL